MLTGHNPEQMLDAALNALKNDSEWQSVLDELPVPIYIADSEGAVTYWNRACIDFAGRVPQLGQDRWCVTWKIYSTTGEFMPHEQCPMADAIRRQSIVRDSIAIAERPDGSRRAFRPYPTPLFDAQGKLTGAINLLVDVTQEQSEALALQAERCRRLAQAMYNRQTSDVLSTMAERFDQTAAELKTKRRRQPPPP